MAAPSMQERRACWDARDRYWRCLDDHPEDATRCRQLRSSFESSCPQQWGAKSDSLKTLLPQQQDTVKCCDLCRRFQPSPAASILQSSPGFTSLSCSGRGLCSCPPELPSQVSSCSSPTNCPTIKYFDKRRDYLKFKEKFEAGQFQPSKPTENS